MRLAFPGWKQASLRHESRVDAANANARLYRVGPIQPYFSDARLCITFWQNVAIVDVSAELDLLRMRKIGVSYMKLLELHPRGIVTLVILRPGTPIAKPDARAEIVRSNKALGERLLYVASVVEDRGMMAQVLRTVLRGVSMLMGQTRINVFEDVEGALLATHNLVTAAQGEPPGLRSFREAVRQVRASFQPPARTSTQPTR